MDCFDGVRMSILNMSYVGGNHISNNDRSKVVNAPDGQPITELKITPCSTTNVIYPHSGDIPT